MPIDIAALAATVVTSFLLPYIKDGAKKVADALVEKGSKAAVEHIPKLASRLWDRVKAVFSSEDDQAVLKQFETRPDAAKSLVQDILKEKLEHDSRLAEELDQLVNTPSLEGKSPSLLIKDVIGDVGVLYMPGADLSHAQGVRLAGVMKNYGDRGQDVKPPLTSEEKDPNKST
ncbi:MAG: hypothetical protein ACFFCW_00050 [Candidatus Hodarchaeota archaeon]